MSEFPWSDQSTSPFRSSELSVEILEEQNNKQTRLASIFSQLFV